ncbi:arginase family protein [Ktedonosporobacter rubrisoli]|uniref:arginase family protein n=1 Tax=Ktedonosporobacter rubrisoli TaxID=2509675 RepID=UPI0013EE7A1E|nr:arginase family protein [Ktedonosporobacter rubrisoli]
MEISIICVPFQIDVGRWGCALGPQAYLNAGLIDRLRSAGHTVIDPVWIELPNKERTRDTITNLGRIAHYTSEQVSAALHNPDRIALVLEGDCNHAPGAIGGVAQACGSAGVAWFDAHGDMATMETTTSGMIGGMPYAVALGWEFADWREAAGLDTPVRPEAAALLGTSDLDPGEIAALQTHPILHLDAHELTHANVSERVAQAFRPRLNEAAGWYVHIDLDVAGPEVVPGALTPAPYWPPRQNLLEAAATLGHLLPIKALSLAAYNPSSDPGKLGSIFGIEMAMAVIGTS